MQHVRKAGDVPSVEAFKHGNLSRKSVYLNKESSGGENIPCMTLKYG